jgi:phospholipase C
MMSLQRLLVVLLSCSAVAAVGVVGVELSTAGASDSHWAREHASIRHVVVIYQENNSFDHYFGTYPYAANSTSGEPSFYPRQDTPAVNGLDDTL